MIGNLNRAAKRRRRGFLRAAWAGAVLAAATLRAAPPAGAGSGYELIFADEFSGASLDTVKGWIDSYPWGRTHNHEAYMASDHVIPGGGTLTLKAERAAQGGKSFTSGAISTGYSNFRFTGGYAEARIFLPTTPGSWPAFWGLDDGWPPEIDVMEFPLTTDGGVSGYPNTDYHTAYHYTNSSGDHTAGAGRVNPGSAGALNTAWHTYGVHWVDNTSVTFYFDGAQVSSYSGGSVGQMDAMYLILNYAVGGWPGTPTTSQWPNAFADETSVDWVRVWQQRPGGSSVTSVWDIAGGGSWDTAGNWTGLVPKYGGQHSVFGLFGTATPAAVDWSFSRTVGGVTFAGTNTAFTLGSGDESLQLAGTGGTAGAFVEALATSRTNQTIAARIELYNDTEFRNQMTNGARLVLNGVLIGDGDLTVSGEGPVQFSNNNTYTGATFIGVGQGPAVARVTRSRPFGTNGVVTIGPGGNATTARIEIQDNREVPSAINFNGRNPNYAGIENLGGSNTFSGTISAQVGGSNYIITSSAGLLTLSGANSAAGGVAMRAGATGARAFKLWGAGDGLISGVIANGSGTVSVFTASTGVWTLTATNTYTGTTMVNEGTLLVNGRNSGTGAVIVTDGGTLGGHGTIRGPVTVQTGGVLSPGASIGRLTVSNTVALNPGSTSRFEITRSGPGSDTLVSTGALACGGALVVTNLGPALVAGDTFTVLVASAVSGTFSATNLPSLSPATLKWNVAYQPSAVVLSVTNPPTGYDAYALQIANAAQRGITNDADADGYANLLEYVTGGNPTNADTAARMNAAITNGIFALRFTRATNATDATLLVQGSDAATNNAPWQTIAINSNGLWTGAASVTEIGASPVTVTARDTAPAATNRFLRLRVTRP